MTVLCIRYLTGYAVAAEHPAGEPEWPPHPGRVFMALAAAHFDTGEDSAERRALEWIERQPAPAIQASPATPRSDYEAYVPANDQQTLNALVARTRQPRSFPKTRPDDDTVLLAWASEPAAELRTALAALCTKVTRIGHSSSLVQMWLLDTDPQPPELNWHPEEGLNARRFRVTGEGTLRMLERNFNRDAVEEYGRLAESVESARGAAKTRLKTQLKVRYPGGPPKSDHPQLNKWQVYSKKKEADPNQQTANGPFDPDFIVLSLFEGCSLGLESTLQLTGALRNAAMKKAGEFPPEWLTGHAGDGTPSRSLHAAFFPLPFVGHSHADGHVMGLGMALPRGLTTAEIRTRLGPLFFDLETGESRKVHLWRNDVWDWKMDRETRESPPLTLRRETWTGPSRVWASVTPVVLHHHPKKREGDLERILLEACASAQLPQPEKLAVRSASAHAGGGHVRSLPPYDEGPDGLCRYQTHIEVRFAVPVRGPLLIGRGRYRGYGLLKPLESPQWLS